MIGKIVSYSQESGKGKIFLKSGQKYDFSIDDWMDYDNLPAINLEVEFEIIDRVAKKLRPATSKNLQTNSKKDKNKKNKKIFKIEITVPIDECLKSYFEPILNIIEKNKNLPKLKKLDYSKVRNFIETAYNNLKDIDYNYENQELLKRKNELYEIYVKYISFKNEVKIPKRAYEKIFINKQTEYLKSLKKVNENINMISIYESKIKSAEKEIEELEKKVEKLKNSAENYLDTEDNLKKLRRNLVDFIHERAKLQEENELLLKLTDEFYEENYNLFTEKLNDFIKINLPQIKKILDIKAYQFDSFIWEEAKKSSAIKKFFQQSGVYEDYSSLTFLKYYISSLDKDKLSQKNKELYEILKYYEENKIQILCCDNDLDFLKTLKEIIKKIDKEINVEISTQTSEIVLKAKENLHSFIIDPTIPTINLDKVISFIEQKSKDCQIIFIAQQLNKTILLNAKKYNVGYIIKKSLSTNQLENELKKIFKDE